MMGFSTMGVPATRASIIRPRRRARAGELLLADLMERELRAPLGRIAVVVRLSRLAAPGPRPYHRRIARALLEDCAQRHGGQVFQLGTGDLILLCVPPAGDPPGGPLALPPLLARLLQADGGTPEAIADAIPLADGRDRLAALLDAAADADEAAPEAAGQDGPLYDTEPYGAEPDGIARMTTASGPPRPRNIFARDQAPSGGAPSEAAHVLQGGIAALLQFQTAARLPARGAMPVTPIRPVHRALRVAPSLLAARLAGKRMVGQDGAGGRDLSADPWLRQHLTSSLAIALLEQLQRSWGSGGPLDATPRRGAPPLLLALPPAVVNSAAFEAFAVRVAAGLTSAPAPRVAISMAEASADPAGFAAARDRLRGAGMALVLDGLSHHALTLARPEALEPDLLSLAWSSALPRLPDARLGEIAAAVQRIGAGRIVLTGADSEAALRWGRAAGIQMFQGSHAEAMLAATRLMQCPGATACPLRVCAERATAASAAGRAGCTNHRLLDQGVPDPVQAVS